MKKRILLSLLLAASTSAFADSSEKKDAYLYAEANNVSISEADRALTIEANTDALIDKINNEFKGRVAGIYVEHTPEYKIIVKLKGNGKNEKRELKIDAAIPNNEIPVEFQYGAKVTKEAGKGQMKKAGALAKNYFSTVRMVSYNEITGEIDIEIKEKSSPEVQSKIQELKKSWKNPNVPINVILVSYSIVPMALAHGGTPVIDKSQVSTTGMAEICTTGFGIKDSSGKKYMSTAAHCPDNFEDKKTGARYSFVNEIPYTQGNDIQWNSTSDTVTNQFYTGANTTRTLTGRRTLAYTNVNSEVCHYGNSTQFSCGKVEKVGVSLSEIDPQNGSQYPGEFWVRVATSSCKGGDSGGPAFTGRTIASGIVSLAITDDLNDNNPSNDVCIGYLYVPTDKIYENGLSFVY